MGLSIDPEKVISGLKLLAHWPDGLIITDKEKWITPCCEMAVVLLKEQEAVKPIRDKKTGRVWLCGNCGSYVGFEDHDEDDPNEFDKFCRECGHPVSWERR